jgi:hypothetical protein
VTFFLFVLNCSAFITGWAYSLANVIATGATNVTVGKTKEKLNLFVP